MPGRFPFLDDDALARRLQALVDGGTSAGSSASRVPPSVRAADVVLDSASDPLDPFRSAAVLDARQVVLRTDGFTIVVDIAGTDGEWLLTGQLLPDSSDPGPVVVQVIDGAGEELGLSVVGESGEFECASSAQPQELIVACEQGDVVVDLSPPGA